MQAHLRSLRILCLGLGLGSALPACWFVDDGETVGESASESSTSGGDSWGTTSMSPTTSGTSSPDTTATSATTSPETGDDPSGGTGSTPVACVTVDDCPGILCRQASCAAGFCDYTPLDAGTLVDDTVGDCRQTQCDGVGGGQMVAADDPPEDTIGDCKKTGCDAGEIVYLPDDADLSNDGVECTADTCEAGDPVFTPKPSNTFCGPQGAHYCHTDTACRRCKELADPCDDPGPEPNETQETAHHLGTISDPDSSGSFLCGSLAGEEDVDWYVYEGNDTIFGVVDPTRVLASKGSGRLCVYAECLKGTTFVSCGGGLTADTAPLGQEGCCGSGKVAPKLECSGFDDGAMIWIRVDNPVPACLAYDLDYHF